MTELLDVLFYAVMFCGVFIFAFIIIMIVNREVRNEFLDEIRKVK